MLISEIICDIIIKFNIKKIFAIPGDYNLDLLNKLIENKRNIKSIYFCNELNMGYASDGYARINGLSVLITTFSVGSLSCLNAIAGCMSESSPVIHISIVPNLLNDTGEKLLHHSVNKDTKYTEKMYKYITLNSKRLSDHNKLPFEMIEMFNESLVNKKPVNIEIPQNLLNIDLKNYDFNISNLKSIKYKNTSINNLNFIIQKIKKIKKPLIIIGTESNNWDKDEIISLINSKNIPFLTLINSRGIIPEDNKNYSGIYWPKCNTREVEKIFNNSDGIIYLGCIFNDYNSTSFSIKNKNDFLSIDEYFTKVFLNDNLYKINYLEVLKLIKKNIPESQVKL